MLPGSPTRREPDSDSEIFLVRHPDPSKLNRSGLALRNLRAASRREKTGRVLVPEAETTQSTLDPLRRFP